MPVENADIQAYSVTTGTTMFISTSPMDSGAVGLALPDPNGIQDPERFTDLIHPLDSSQVMIVFNTPLHELDLYASGTPFQNGELTIPEEYFRSPIESKLAELLDKRYLEKNDGEIPEGEELPSKSWDGKWYFYVCSWWKVVGPAERAPH